MINGENMTDIGFGIACAGLWSVIAFGQTVRHMATNKFNAILGLFQIPAAISLLWRIAIDIHWWTVLVFIGVSLAVGITSGIITQRYGSGVHFNFQSAYGLILLTSSVICWFL